MANASKTTTLRSDAQGKFNLAASFNETATSEANNTSTLTVSASLSSADGSYFSTSQKGTMEIWWYDNNLNTNGVKCGSVDVGTINSSTSASVSKSITVTHKNDGTVSGYAKAVWKQGTYANYKPNSGNVSTANTALTPLQVVPATPTVSAEVVSATTVNVTYGTTSFGNPSTGTVYLYGSTSATPSVVIDSSSRTGDNLAVRSGLVGNTAYHYRSNATNGQRSSDYSQEITVITPCPALATLTLSSIGDTQTTATFNYTLASDGGYHNVRTLEYSLDGDTWEVIGTAFASGTFTIDGLTPDTEYTIYTRLVTDAGDGMTRSLTFSTEREGFGGVYGSVNGVAKKVNAVYGSVNGAAKKVVAIYGSVDGVAKKVL